MCTILLQLDFYHRAFFQSGQLLMLVTHQKAKDKTSGNNTLLLLKSYPYNAREENNSYMLYSVILDECY